MAKIRMLKISGTPYEMGKQHGKAFATGIRSLAEERVRLCLDESWTGRQLSWDRVLELAEASIHHHEVYAPELVEELEGISSCTGLTRAELLIANGFTDFVDTLYNSSSESTSPAFAANECTTFIASGKASADGHSILGQTWDMHASAAPHVIAIHAQPKDHPAYLAFTLTGCVGMIGLNEAGICVGINNLISADGQVGVTWPFVVRKILQQETIEDALRCLRSAPLAGGHNYILGDAHGNAYQVEAMPTVAHAEWIDEGVVAHANACVYHQTKRAERPLTMDWLQDSHTRRSRAEALLQHESVTVEDCMALTRDEANGSYSICSRSEAPYYSETCGAVIMRPATREFWGLWGLPTLSEYERFVL